ncbi:branched-chain amino acid ABC transporter permease [Bosea sp. 2YAB26]|uniref:branched-chain amino acid ABC transporter permease n=1 Tax=Bosea sp. 2YAB26 TaxID=3237478 RepID=UPI003F8E938D
MNAFLAGHGTLVELILLNALLAYSQAIVLRAGVFSLATAGLASIGAYAAALLTTRLGAPMPLGLLAGAGGGIVGALLLSVPLARLRGVYQAIATLAFVQIVLSLMLFAEPVTGGALGLNNLPKLVGVGTLALLVGATLYVFISLSRTSLGRAFDTIREEETVAASLGIDVVRQQRIAFAISGALAGLAGAAMSYRNYSLVPEDFGFPVVVAALTFVVLGGKDSAFGPLLGAAVLTALPELARPFADYRLAVNGLVMLIAIVYFPAGIAQAWCAIANWRARRGAAA